jgi:hypothetical protein
MGFAGPVAHYNVSRAGNVDTLFFMPGWAQCDLNKKRVGTRHVELVFLHTMGSAGHVVHSGRSGPQNVDTLFFMLGWASTDSTKSISGHVTPNLSLCIYFDLWVTQYITACLGHESSTHYFSCSGGSGVVSIKSALRHVMPKFFMLGCARCCFHKKHTGTF